MKIGVWNHDSKRNTTWLAIRKGRKIALKHQMPDLPSLITDSAIRKKCYGKYSQHNQKMMKDNNLKGGKENEMKMRNAATK